MDILKKLFEGKDTMEIATLVGGLVLGIGALAIIFGGDDADVVPAQNVEVYDGNSVKEASDIPTNSEA